MLEEGKFKNRDGIELHYMEQTSYDSDLKPVFIIPALPESDMDYKDIIYVLPNHAVCVTPRGRELSDAPETGYSVQDHANDIIDTMEHFKLEETTVIAYSRGVAYFLQALPEIKDKINGLILIDYPAQYDNHPANWAKQFLEQSWRAMPIKERFPGRPWVLERIEQESTYVNLWENLMGIDFPVRLFIGGGEFSDPVLIPSKITEDHIKKYKIYIPDIKIIEFENSGHDLRLWEYEKFMTEVKNFLDEVNPHPVVPVVAESDTSKEENNQKEEKRKEKKSKKKKEKISLYGFNPDKLIKLN